MSKFKNALGEVQKKNFSNCSVTTVSTEGRYIAVNGNFLAMAWSNAGEIVVVDSSEFGRVKADHPRIKGHRANVLDLEFSPFSSDLLAASFDDCSVLLYQIPEGGLTEHLTKEVQIYQKHMKKVPFVTFNPVASDVVCTGAFGADIHVWNALKGETYAELKADETPTCLQWNPNGTLIGATTKKKNINIFDPRANQLIMTQLINEQFQAAKFSWVDNDRFVTTSWTKTKAKMLRLWDIRKEGEVTSVKIDSSTTVTTPFVDKESQLIYTIGKGESIMRTYDYSAGTFVKGIDFSGGGAEPSICTVMFDRKCVDYNTLEVDRFARYVNNQKIYYITYTIPRRNPGYDPSLYPPVECGEPALNYDQWVSGQTSEPIKKDINTLENKFVSKVETFVKQEVKVEAKTPEMKIKELEDKISQMTVKITNLTAENEKLRKQLEAKKAQQTEQQEQNVEQQKEEVEEQQDENQQQEENQQQVQEEENAENNQQQYEEKEENQGGEIIIQKEEDHEEGSQEEQPQEEQQQDEQQQDEQQQEDQQQEEEQGNELHIEMQQNDQEEHLQEEENPDENNE